MKNPERLIGKKVYGFKFYDTKEMIYFRNIMNHYIGKTGTITKLFEEKISFQVTFEDGYSFAYPADQIEDHLVEDEIPTSAAYILGYSLLFYIFSVFFSIFWRKKFDNGPLELLMRKISG